MSRAALWRSWLLAAASLAWLVAVGCGMWVLIAYAAMPGDAGAPPADWPRDTALSPPAGRPLLIVWAHPGCPCTRATLEELARLMTRSAGKLDARVVFYAPAGSGEDFWRTDTWRSAAAIPGVEVVLDRDAVESRRFRTETSGHALLYDASGRLLFSGGITAARGHAGDNAGLASIETLVDGGRAGRRSTPVFGCALHDWSAAPAPREVPWTR